MTLRAGQRVKVLTVKDEQYGTLRICVVPDEMYAHPGDVVRLEDNKIRTVITVQDYVDEEELAKIASSLNAPILEVQEIYSAKQIRWGV